MKYILAALTIIGITAMSAFAESAVNPAVFQMRLPIAIKSDPFTNQMNNGLTSIGAQILLNSKAKQLPLTLFNSCVSLHGISVNSPTATEGLCIPIKIAGGQANLNQIVFRVAL